MGKNLWKKNNKDRPMKETDNIIARSEIFPPNNTFLIISIESARPMKNLR